MGLDSVTRLTKKRNAAWFEQESHVLQQSDNPTSPPDLSNCAREPIHIPGAIQPHGALIAADARTRRILQVSENCSAVLGREMTTLLHAPLTTLVPPTTLDELSAALRLDARSAATTVALMVSDSEKLFDVVAHRSDDNLLLEFEPIETSATGEIEAFFDHLRFAAAELQESESVQGVADAVVSSFARISGFDRVMTYRFDREWHGAVIAESRDDALSSFLGLHYPASDVPSQARELYERNAVRVIPDARYIAARLVPSIDPLRNLPLDLSQSILRSVSPVHLEYLANMDVAATLTVSLLKHGKLWGLIACHHRVPRKVSYRLRGACELLGRTASMRITELEETADANLRLRLRALQPALTAAISREGNFTAAIGGSPELLEITAATGAAIKTEGVPTLVGKTPRQSTVRAIIAWLDERNDPESPFVTDALPLVNPDFEDCKDVACGLLAIPLTTDVGGWLLWFRPEVIRTVEWGGDPNKPVDYDGTRLSPRRSFEAWKETVSLHALPWQSVEVDAAIELRRLLSDVMMRRAREYAKLNAELARSNEELDSFAQLASHDLREPLRGLSNYARFVRSDYGARLDDKGIEMLDSINTLARRMDVQITSLLELARVGQDRPVDQLVAVDSALDEALGLLAPLLHETNTDIQRMPLPSIAMHPSRLREILVNLIGNAIKYTTHHARRIEVGASDAIPTERAANRSATPTEAMATIYVRDNGIGIEPRQLETIFRMFKRLHPAGAYGGGTGAGLAIARKIVERNGGVMWAESNPGQGSTFYFTAPLRR